MTVVKNHEEEIEKQKPHFGLNKAKLNVSLACPCKFLQTM